MNDRLTGLDVAELPSAVMFREANDILSVVQWAASMRRTGRYGCSRVGMQPLSSVSNGLS
jgi:hypothetical protein